MCAFSPIATYTDEEEKWLNMQLEVMTDVYRSVPIGKILMGDEFVKILDRQKF